jgi:putative ABC transport system permease protein
MHFRKARKATFSTTNQQNEMIRNYLKIAFRNLGKYKFISFINLFGLTIGLTCCLLILTYITNELSYDRYNKNAENIYRVTRSWNDASGEQNLHLGTIAPPFGPLLKNDFPDIKNITVLLSSGTTTFRYEEKRFNERNGYFADPELFKVFDVKVLRGNPHKALNEPYTVMLSEELAEKYFGKEDPLNKVIRADNQFQLKVTGIFRKFPPNAHLHPTHLISFATLKDTLVYGEENLRTNFGNNSFFTYLLLPERYPVKQLESQFPAFIDKHMPVGGSGNKESKFTALSLQKLTDIHLKSHLDFEAEENGDIKRVYIFSAIALFILLIASINYMNLSTARSALRAREIGVRKVVGAQKQTLIAQFLTESVLLSWIAILLSLLLTWLSLPWLNRLSGQELSLNILYSWPVLTALLVAPFIVGIVSGIYPALFLSSFKPIHVLKGLVQTGGGSVSFRKVLVVTQFSISIILIISTVIVFKQLNYMQQKSLGYERNHMITLPYNTALNTPFETFRTQLLQNSGIKEVARSSRIPTGRLLDTQGAFTLSGDSMQPVTVAIKNVLVDHYFIPAYNIKILAGRNFSTEFTSDTTAFVLNQAAVTAIGWKEPQEAVGKPFRYGNTNGKIIGVINDIHFESLHEKMVPLIFVLPRGPFYSNISVRVAGSHVKPALAVLEKTWQQFMPETPFEYNFLDENFDRLYQSEQRQGAIFTVFACIAIFIACLGLFGLSAFTITQRIKEIGIRKVLGATVGSIVSLLSKDFLKLVVIAAIIAFPIAWMVMRQWLEDFAYRIDIPWWAFVAAGLIAAIVAFATISLQAVKAAVSNPVKNLRTE